MQDQLIDQFLGGSVTTNVYLKKTLKLNNLEGEKQRLNDGLDCVENKLHHEVAEHHEELMQQVTSLRTIEQKLDAVRGSVATLQSSVKRMKHTIQEPSEFIQARVTQLQHMWTTKELFETVQTFLGLLLKLKEQTAEGVSEATPKVGPAVPSAPLELTKVAKYVHDIEKLLDEVDLKGIEIVDQERPFITSTSKSIRKKAHEVLQTALQDQNQTQVGVALQTFYNLDCLPEVVKDLVSKQRQTCRVYIYNQLKAEDNFTTSKQDQNVVRTSVFQKISNVTEHVAKNFAQLAQLYKVLSKRRDPVNHTTFLQVVMSSIGPDFLPDFWSEITTALNNRLMVMVRGNSVINQVLVSEYPRLHRLFNGFIQSCSDHFYWLSPPAPKTTPDPYAWLKNTMQQFERQFQDASFNRLCEKVDALAHKMAQGCPNSEERAKEVPSDKEKHTLIMLQPSDLRLLIATINQELTATHGESTLSPVVLSNIAKALLLFHARCKKHVITKWTCSGQITTNCNKAQLHNMSIYNALCKLAADVVQLLSNQPRIVSSASSMSPTTSSVDNDSLETANKRALLNLYDHLAETVTQANNIIKPIFVTATKYAEKLLLKLHKENYAEVAQGKSAYIQDLENRLLNIKNKILSGLDSNTQPYEKLCKQLASRILNFWVRHACLIPHLSETAKLKLASDVVHVHFATTNLYNVEKLGTPFRELRAFRSVMFMDTSAIPMSNEVKNAVLHPVNTVHHLISRSKDLLFPYECDEMPIEVFSDELDTVFAEQQTEKKDTMNITEAIPQLYDNFSEWWHGVEDMLEEKEKGLCDEDKEIVEAIHAVGDMFWPLDG